MITIDISDVAVARIEKMLQKPGNEGLGARIRMRRD